MRSPRSRHKFRYLIHVVDYVPGRGTEIEDSFFVDAHSATEAKRIGQRRFEQEAKRRFRAEVGDVDSPVGDVWYANTEDEPEPGAYARRGEG
jgi:hypothetical protein